MLGDVLSTLLGVPNQQEEAPFQIGGTAPPVAPQQAMLAPSPAPKKPGTMSLGGGVRNVLGAIGDALLVANGRNPIYQQRLQNFKESQALQGFTSDPLGAIKRLAEVNPRAAMDRFNEYTDNSRLDRSEARLTRDADQDYNDTVVERALRMYGIANEKNWSALRPIIQSYASKHGVELPFELPEQFDPNLISAHRSMGVSVKDQIDDEETRRYHNDTSRYRNERLEDFDISEENDQSYRSQRLEDFDESREETERHNRSVEGRQGPSKATRTVQTRHGAVTFNADSTLAGHTDANGVQTRMKRVGGKWVPVERIVPSASGGDHYFNVNGKWVLKEESE